MVRRGFLLVLGCLVAAYLPFALQGCGYSGSANAWATLTDPNSDDATVAALGTYVGQPGDWPLHRGTAYQYGAALEVYYPVVDNLSAIGEISNIAQLAATPTPSTGPSFPISWTAHYPQAMQCHWKQAWWEWDKRWTSITVRHDPDPYNSINGGTLTPTLSGNCTQSSCAQGGYIYAWFAISSPGFTSNPTGWYYAPVEYPNYPP